MADPDAERDPIEVLAAEFIERQRQGQRPTVEEYARQHPELANDIRELFPTIVSVEQLKAEKELSSGGRALGRGTGLDRLGDFRIIREIGRGGMGIVYEAEQESLGRHVAVKVLPRHALLDPKQLSRFQREARTAARLHHTNIVPVFGVGEQDGYHYLVMQYIRGVGLDEVVRQLESTRGRGENRSAAPAADRAYPAAIRTGEVRDVARALLAGSFQAEGEPGSSPGGADDLVDRRGAHQQSVILTDSGGCDSADKSIAARPIGARYWRSAARIGLQVADALEYAHTQGTLHRDIKPANLLLDTRGVVWVADFGLAKAAEHDLVSQTGDVVGTLRYMAPERFSGQSDARSDIYSLGLTLYEMITLRPAYDDADRSALIRSITHGTTTPPRRLDARIPRDLETIVLKSTARDPAHRYQTAADLGADLQRFIEDRPIQARRATPLERCWRWSKRNRAVAALTGTAALLLMLVAVVASVGFVRTREANLEVRDALNDVSTQRRRAEATSELALEALDTIFEQFAPNRMAATPELTLEAATDDQLEVPTQPVLSKEAAALLEHLLEFYDRLAESGDDDATLRHKVADANRRVGDIRQRLGHPEQAQEAYQRAIDLYRQLESESPSNTTLRIEIARIHNELASMWQTAERPDQGHASLLTARAILQSVTSGTTASPQQRYELARTYFLLGRRGPHYPGDKPRRPGPGHPERSPGRRDTGGGVKPPPSGAGSARQATSSRQEKTAHLQDAIHLLRDLVNEHPTVPDYRRLLALCYRDLPPARPGVDQPSASDATDLATEILQSLVDEYPDVPEYRYDLCETYAMSARPSTASEEDPRTVVERLTTALNISEQLVAERPNIPDYAMSQVRIRHRLANTLLRLDSRDAEKHLRAALSLQTSLVRRFPEVPTYRLWLAIVQESLAGTLRGPQRLDEARAFTEASIATLGEVPPDEAGKRRVRSLLTRNYRRLASILDRLGEDQLAAQALQEAEKLSDRGTAARPPKTGLLRNDDTECKGYTLFAPLRSTTSYLIDMQGRVVHTWHSNLPPGNAVYLLPSGNLLRCGRNRDNETFHGGGIGGLIQEFDWDGNLVWEFEYSDSRHCQHHDIEPLPNGNVLILAWERKTQSEAIAAGRDPESLEQGELWPDHVIEVQPSRPNGGRIVWEWHVWDHLIQDHDPTKDNYGNVAEHPELIDINPGKPPMQLPQAELRRLRALGYIGGDQSAGPRKGEGNADWNHTNSIAYNAELDQIALSVLGFNEVWIIDHSTTTEEAAGHTGGRGGKGGDLLYRWGNPAVYRAGAAEDRRFFGQHDVQWVAPGHPGEGNLLIFNNGRDRPDGSYSSIVELTPPVNDQGHYTRQPGCAFGPEQPAWVYTAPERTRFFSGHISGAQRLPNGHTLICAGEQGRFFEVDLDGNTIWDYGNPFGGEVREPRRGGGPKGLRRRPGGPPDDARGDHLRHDQDRPRGRRHGKPPDGPRGRRGPGRGRGPGRHDEATAVFRATRLAPDHPGLAGKDLRPFETK